MLRRSAVVLISRSVAIWPAVSQLPERCQTAACMNPVVTAKAFWSRDFGSLAEKENPHHRKSNLFNGPAQSLEFQRATLVPVPSVQNSAVKRLLLKVAGYYSQESKNIRGAKGLFQAVVEQSTAPELFQVLGLEQNFANTHALFVVHIWLLLRRLRPEGNDGKQVTQLLYDQFQSDVDHRVRAAGVKVRISKWLAEFEKIFYGSCESYEKAMAGEEELVDALMRNVFGADASKSAEAALLARYMRRELACLSQTESATVLSGNIKFSPATKL